jgi:anaerobic selenocysteine-containing dehydrogenase
MSTPETRYRICPLCEACCGLDVQVADGKVIAIRGKANDAFSHGYICPKGYALKDLHEDPDRLRQPLVRRNGSLQPATWEEAFDEIERRLLPVIEQHGRDAVALTVGNPSAHKMSLLLYFARLARALGSKNIFSASTLDQMPKQLASGWMFGHWLSVAVPDIDRCDFLLILGANPMASNGSMWTVTDFRGRAKALRQRGGQIVVVDPRRSETAAIADAHHPIRPGADVFLLAAMVHTLFDEGLARPGRLADWTLGIDDVRAAVAPFSPEAVAERCAIPAATIRGLARQLAATERACVYGRIGTCTQAFGTLSSWLIDVLNVLTGHLDAPGGAMFPKAPAFAANTQGKPGTGRGVTTGRHASRVSGAPEVFGELPMTLLAEEIETPGKGQVRALISVASNPVLSSPGGPRLEKALDSLDFMLSLDIYLNETTRHADVILPPPSALQKPHYDLALLQVALRNVANFSPAVLPLDEGQPDEWEILSRLALVAQGMGAGADAAIVDDLVITTLVNGAVGDAYGPVHGRDPAEILAALEPRRGPERLLDLMLRTGPYGDGFGARTEEVLPGVPLLSLDVLLANPHGVDLGALMPRLPEVLRTPTGMVDVAVPEVLVDLPRLQAALDRPVPEAVLVGRRDLRSNNSWMHNIEVLVKGRPRCTLHVHPDDAERWGLADGGSAVVTGRVGTLEVPVEVTDAIRAGVVSLPHGWGHDLPGVQLGVAGRHAGVNSNVLSDELVVDVPSGNAVLNGIPVAVVPA